MRSASLVYTAKHCDDRCNETFFPSFHFQEDNIERLLSQAVLPHEPSIFDLREFFDPSTPDREAPPEPSTLNLEAIGHEPETLGRESTRGEPGVQHRVSEARDYDANNVNTFEVDSSCELLAVRDVLDILTRGGQRRFKKIGHLIFFPRKETDRRSAIRARLMNLSEIRLYLGACVEQQVLDVCRRHNHAANFELMPLRPRYPGAETVLCKVNEIPRPFEIPLGFRANAAKIYKSLRSINRCNRFVVKIPVGIPVGFNSDYRDGDVVRLDLAGKVKPARMFYYIAEFQYGPVGKTIRLTSDWPHFPVPAFREGGDVHLGLFKADTVFRNSTFYLPEQPVNFITCTQTENTSSLRAIKKSISTKGKDQARDIFREESLAGYLARFIQNANPGSPSDDSDEGPTESQLDLKFEALCDFIRSENDKAREENQKAFRDNREDLRCIRSNTNKQAVLWAGFINARSRPELST